MLWESFQVNVKNKYASGFEQGAEYAIIWITIIYITYAILICI